MSSNDEILNILTSLEVEYINCNIKYNNTDTSPIDISSHSSTVCSCRGLLPCGQNWLCFNYAAQMQCPINFNVADCKNQVFYFFKNILFRSNFFFESLYVIHEI
jgi:hypothetical protein